MRHQSRIGSLITLSLLALAVRNDFQTRLTSPYRDAKTVRMANLSGRVVSKLLHLAAFCTIRCAVESTLMSKSVGMLARTRRGPLKVRL